MTDDNDPFAPFKRMMEQFNPGESSGVSGFGVPMAPFPGMPMGSMDAPLSPEANTRSAVRQLYTAIEELGGSSGSPPTNLWQQYQDAFNLDSSAWSPERFWSYAMTTNQIWLHSLSQLLVEAYTIRLIHDDLVSDDHRHASATQEWLWNLPQPDREQLLLRCLAVDEDVIAEMRAARERRNELLYDIGSWDEMDFEAPVADARRYLRVLDHLDDLVTDGKGFQYLPDSADKDGEQGENETDDEGSE